MGVVGTVLLAALVSPCDDRVFILSSESMSFLFFFFGFKVPAGGPSVGGLPSLFSVAPNFG